MIQYEKGHLALWGLKSHAKITEIPLKGISYIHCSFDSKSYFVGFKDGNVEEYDNAKLEKWEDYKYPNIGSEVTGIISSLNYCFYSSKEGKVIMFKFTPDKKNKDAE